MLLASYSGPTRVLAVMTAHFTDLLGGASELSSEVCNRLEADIFTFEQQEADTGDESGGSAQPWLRLPHV